MSSDIGDDSGIPSSTSYLRSPSIPQAKSKTLRRSPRKRNCVSSDPDDLPCLSPTFSKISGELKHLHIKMHVIETWTL